MNLTETIMMTLRIIEVKDDNEILGKSVIQLGNQSIEIRKVDVGSAAFDK